jgi:hypothetical protein
MHSSFALLDFKKILEIIMIKRRNRFKQTVPLKDRLLAFAADLRNQASIMPSGRQRDELLKRARRVDTAAHLDDWLNSPGLQPPAGARAQRSLNRVVLDVDDRRPIEPGKLLDARHRPQL